MEASLVLRGGSVVDVDSGAIVAADVAVAGDRIAAVGESLPAAPREIDCTGRFIAPGLIDGHIHIESSLLSPWEFAAAVSRRGTTTVVADAHEIANVSGMDGARYMAEAARGSSIEVLLAAPSCVPATRLETSGAELGPEAVAELLDWPEVVALGEVMNFPGVLAGDEGVRAKLAAARERGMPIDGHAPGLLGAGLRAYIAAGPDSDHECTSLGEAREKLAAGMWIMIREGTAARNMDDLLPLAMDPSAAGRCLFVTDDLAAHELHRHGHLDRILLRAVSRGLGPVDAVRMVTLRPAERFGLDDRGRIAPGLLADLVVFEDLASFHASTVLKRGVEADQLRSRAPVEPPIGTCRLPDLPPDALVVRATDSPVRVIGTSPGQIVTECQAMSLPLRDDQVVADPEHDVLKVAVIERHGRGGGVGVGFVRGLGLREGAIGSTVAHDSHNLIVAGASDESMLAAVRALTAEGGGFVAVGPSARGAVLPLPIAGLMSGRCLEDVVSSYDKLLAAARSLGSEHPDPLAALSFLALPVIPELKITDRGLVDVGRFEHVPLAVGGADE